MFTGLVEEIGRVDKLEPQGDALRLTIGAGKVLSDVSFGDSIAVNGVCLTVVEHTDEWFTADVMQESLDRTGLGHLEVGSRVNLERALAAGARLGGHIMQGHVDGTGAIVSRTPGEHWEVVRISLPDELDRYVVEKGSIAVDGTSLTVSAVGGEPGAHWFEVSLIPTTLAETIMGSLAEGSAVNLEVDVVAKYIEKLLPR